MMEILLLTTFCFFWLIALTLVAEAWFYEEEQQL